ncbi:gamma-glutamyl-phosphate reductase, partial [Escherichia coli]|nr:gamma-glutamyl-phosphate reductase [Escherichia coli]
HRDVAEDYLPAMETALKEYDVELRADERAKEILQEAKAATESDWEDEFLDFILAIKVVDSAEEAIDHINKYGTKHSEAIISNDYATGQA